jgi:hypothetical protein
MNQVANHLPKSQPSGLNIVVLIYLDTWMNELTQYIMMDKSKDVSISRFINHMAFYLTYLMAGLKSSSSTPWTLMSMARPKP